MRKLIELVSHNAAGAVAAVVVVAVAGAAAHTFSTDDAPVPVDPPVVTEPSPEPPSEAPATPAPATPTEPDDDPTEVPTDEPSEAPSSPAPSSDPEPTDEPSDEPSGEPSEEPTEEPTGEPSEEPTEEPTPDPASPHVSATASWPTVTLTWPADDHTSQFTVNRCAGTGCVPSAVIAVTAANSFDDEPGEGTFTYTVTADGTNGTAVTSEAVTVTLTEPFNPTHVSGIAAWYAPSSTDQTTADVVADRSGNDAHLVQSDPDLQPTWTVQGDRAVLTFDGVDDVTEATFTTATATAVGTELTIYGVARHTATSGTPAVWAELVDASGNHIRVGVDAHGQAGLTGDDTLTWGPITSGWHLWTVRIADGHPTMLAIDGVPVRADKPTAFTGAVTLRVGSAHDGTDYIRHWGGDVAELAYYTRALTTDEQTDVSTDIATRSTLDVDAPDSAADVDIDPPAAPAWLRVDGTTALTWPSSPAADVDHYRVLRNGKLVAREPATATTWVDLDPAAGPYAIEAIDHVGNLSSVRTAGDAEPPTAAFVDLVDGSGVSGQRTVTVTASDVTNDVTDVSVTIDGGAGTVASQVDADTWQTTIDFTALAGSDVTLSTVVTDTVGHTTTTAVTVTVVDATPPVTGGLLNAWTFDAGTGSTVADEWGSDDATWTSTPAWGPGVVNGGSAGPGAYVRAGTAHTLSAATFSYWAKFDSLGSTQMAGRMDIAPRIGVGPSGTSQLVTYIGSVGQGIPLPSPLRTDRWYMLTVTTDGAASNVYLDGRHLAAGPAATFSGVVDHVYLASGYSSGYSIAGAVDTVLLYDRALTATEIAALYDWTAGSRDFIEPTVTVTAPLANAKRTGTFNVTGTVTDNVGADHVDVSVDGVLVGVASVSGTDWTYRWDSTTVTDGARTIEFVAHDAAGNVSAPATRTLNVINDQNVDDAGRTAYWPLDTIDAGTSAETVNGYDATLTGTGFTPVTEGITNAALHNDETGHLTVGYEHLHPTITYSMWLKPDAAGDLNMSGNMAQPYINLMTSSNVHVGAYIGDRQFWAYNAITADTWQMLTLVGDGETARLYVNGQRVGSATYNWQEGAVAELRSLMSGGNIAHEYYRTNGAIDEVQVYPQPFTDAEVQALYETELAGRDFTLPTVTINSPTNGTWRTGVSPVVATATDNVAVDNVTVTIDGTDTYPATLTGSRWEYAWDTTTVADGSHTVTVTATDTSGLSRSVSHTVTVVNTQSIDAKGRAAYWSFDDATGSTVTETVNGYHGTFNGTGQTWSNSAITNGGIVLDGNGHISTDYVHLHDTITLNMWLKRHAGGGTYDGMGSLTSPLLGLLFADGSTTVYYGSSGNGFAMPNTIDRWAMYTLVADGTNISIYVNGELQGTRGYTREQGAVTRNFSIGSANNSTSSHYRTVGELDEVQVFVDPMTAADVAALFTEEAAGRDFTAPSVTINSPMANQTLTSTYDVTVTATDNFAVDRVELSVAGSGPLATATMPTSGDTYELAWDTTTVADGSHTITVTAYDTAGLTTSATRTINVVNTQTVDAQGRTAYWSFDDASGTTVTETANGYHGTFSGTLAWEPDAISGTALRNDEAGHVTTGYVHLHPTFTYSMWVNPHPDEYYYGYHGTLNRNGNNNFRFGTDAAGTLMTVVGNHQTNHGNALTPGVWQHLVVVGDGSTTTVYVDGSQVGTGTYEWRRGTVATGFSLHTMDNYTSAFYRSKAAIDEVAIYRDPMTAAEVSTLYSSYGYTP